MIALVYVPEESCFIWEPEDSQDNMAIIRFFSEKMPEAKVAYNCGNWKFSADLIDEINARCKIYQAELGLKFSRTPSFEAWLRARTARQAVLHTIPAQLKVQVIDTYIVPGSQPLPYEAIDAVTRFFTKAALSMRSYKEGRWDGIIHLFRQRAGYFPTGLLQAVITELDHANITYRVDYEYQTRQNPLYAFSICDGLTPDPDQEEAIEAAWRGGRGIVKAPTGFGKTAILAKRLIVKFGVPTLFVANKKTLLDDAAHEFNAGIIDEQGNHPQVVSIKEGWFCGQRTSDPDLAAITAPIVVATIQSLEARLQDERTATILEHWLKEVCRFIMVDECQAVGTKTWDNVLHHCEAPYRIFLSATPRRTDGATIKLKADSGNILYTTTAEKQIEQNRLCEMNIIYNVYDHRVFNEGDDNLIYDECYKTFIVENEDRNRKMIVEPTLQLVQEGRHVLVLIQQIEHGHLLRRMFLESGLEAEDIRFVWGDTPDKARQSAIVEFRKGDFKVMIGSTIFDAGVNIPIISGVVLGGAGNSDITLIQRIGRGARNCDYEALLGFTPDFVKKYDGKKVTVVYDIIDKNIKFFHNQSRNRYRNASDEFGASRVHIKQGSKADLRTVSKRQRYYNDMIAQAVAQEEVLAAFAQQVQE